ELKFLRGREPAGDEICGTSCCQQTIFRKLENGQTGLRFALGGNQSHAAEQDRQVEVRLPALSHEVQGIFRLTGICRGGVGIEEISDVGARHKAMDEPGKDAAKTSMQVEIGKLVVDIAVEYNDIALGARWCPFFPQHNQAETERVQQIEKVPREG